jgi:hypothetical protein
MPLLQTPLLQTPLLQLQTPMQLPPQSQSPLAPVTADSRARKAAT